eukprot:7025179-Pyramimonas_sp.AAC.1
MPPPLVSSSRPRTPEMLVGMRCRVLQFELCPRAAPQLSSLISSVQWRISGAISQQKDVESS